jgi:hypothetical protein
MTLLRLVFGGMVLALLLVIVAQNHQAAGRPEAPAAPDHRAEVAALRAELERQGKARAAEAADIQLRQNELSGRHDQSLTALRADVRALSQAAERSAAAADRLEKKLAEAPADRKARPEDVEEILALRDELKRLNEQFKRVVDFATGR